MWILRFKHWVTITSPSAGFPSWNFIPQPSKTRTPLEHVKRLTFNCVNGVIWPMLNTWHLSGSPVGFFSQQVEFDEKWYECVSYLRKICNQKTDGSWWIYDTSYKSVISWVLGLESFVSPFHVIHLKIVCPFPSDRFKNDLSIFEWMKGAYVKNYPDS
jgi:hypothetical protein